MLPHFINFHGIHLVVNFISLIYFKTLNQTRCLMKSYDELKAEMKTIQQQMAEVKKSERAVALKKAKGLFKEFGFTAGMLKGSIAEGRKKLK